MPVTSQLTVPTRKSKNAQLIVTSKKALTLNILLQFRALFLKLVFYPNRRTSSFITQPTIRENEIDENVDFEKSFKKGQNSFFWLRICFCLPIFWNFILSRRKS
jgi:hypothetical protein